MAPPATPSVTPPARPAAPSPAETAFAQALVELFGNAANVLGIPWSIAAIYAVIFASPRPLSFADVEERLKLSKGSVSQGLRLLRDFGAIRPANGDDLPAGGRGGAESGLEARRDYYVPDMELRRLIAHLLKERIEPQLASSSRKLAHLVESVPFPDSVEAELVRKRLKYLQSWQRKARKLVPFAKTMLAIGRQ